MADEWDQFPNYQAPSKDPWDEFPDYNPAPKAATAPTAPEERSSAKDVVYQIPQGIYQGAENLYNLPNDLVNWGAKQLGYEPPITPVHLAEDYIAKHGIGDPTTAAGRYARAVSEQLGANALPAAGSIARGAEAVAPLLSSSIGAGVAGQTAQELDLSPGAQLAATLAGGLAPGAFKRFPDPRIRSKTEAAQAAQEEGISVPKAAVASSLVKPLAGRVASLPIVGEPLQNAARTSLDEMGNRVQQIADEYGAGNRATAGENLRDNINDFIGGKSRRIMDMFYRNVDSKVDDTIVNPITNAQALASELLNNQSATVRKVNEAALAPIMDDLKGPGLTYSGIKQMRTTVGSMLNDNLLPQAGTTKPVLKAIYGALTDDLKAAVSNSGGPDALSAFETANTINEMVAKHRESLQRIVGKAGQNPGENVFETMVQMAQDKGKSANISRLELARSAVDSDTWEDFASAFVRRMGLNPNTEEFSPDRFLTAYGKLSPKGKQLLFASATPGKEGLAESLDRLAAINRQFSEFYKMGNPSGTAGANFAASLFGAGSIGGFLNPLVWATTFGSAAGMRAFSWYFARPANVDKMTRTLAARLAYAKNPSPTTEQRLTIATAALANSLKQHAEGRGEEPARAAGGKVKRLPPLKRADGGDATDDATPGIAAPYYGGTLTSDDRDNLIGSIAGLGYRAKDAATRGGFASDILPEAAGKAFDRLAPWFGAPYVAAQMGAQIWPKLQAAIDPEREPDSIPLAEEREYALQRRINRGRWLANPEKFMQKVNERTENPPKPGTVDRLVYEKFLRGLPEEVLDQIVPPEQQKYLMQGKAPVAPTAPKARGGSVQRIK